MTAIEQILTLKVKAEKELAALKKTRDAAKAKAEKALAEYQALDAKVKSTEAALGVTSAPVPQPVAAPAPAAAATPAPKAKATPKAKSAPAAETSAAPQGKVRLKKDGTPAKKPGPAPGTTRKAKAEAAPQAAAPAKGKKGKAPAAESQAPAAAPQAPAKKGPKTQKSRAAEGRRAVLSGERPTLKDAMKQVMGTEVMNSAQIFEKLKEKGWLPNSNDPKNYIGYSLSSMKKDFEPVPAQGRGFYRVRGSATNGAAKVVSNGASQPATKDTILDDAAAILGVN